MVAPKPKINKSMNIDPIVDMIIRRHSKAMNFTQTRYVELLVLTTEDAFQKLREQYPDYADGSIFSAMRHEMFDKMTPPSHIVKNIEWSGGIAE